MSLKKEYDLALLEQEEFNKLQTKRRNKIYDIVWFFFGYIPLTIGVPSIIFSIGNKITSIFPKDIIENYPFVLRIFIAISILILVLLGIIAFIASMCFSIISVISFLSNDTDDSSTPYQRLFWVKLFNKIKTPNRFKELKKRKQEREKTIALYELYKTDDDFRKAYDKVMAD